MCTKHTSKVAAGIQSLQDHLSHTQTHSFMSRLDSLTHSMKAKECPQFTSVLTWRDHLSFARAYCSRISNQHCELVHYVTIAAPTILIFKDIKTCSLQRVPTQSVHLHDVIENRFIVIAQLKPVF